MSLPTSDSGNPTLDYPDVRAKELTILDVKANEPTLLDVKANELALGLVTIHGRAAASVWQPVVVSLQLDADLTRPIGTRPQIAEKRSLDGSTQRQRCLFAEERAYVCDEILRKLLI